MALKQCKYCKQEFDNATRPSSSICFNCMPCGLTPSQQHTIKKTLERKYNPKILNCPNCNNTFELPYGEINRKYCYNCMPKGLTKNEQASKARMMGKKRALEYLGEKCYICGFDKYISALEFHHIDGGEDKNFNLSNYFTGCNLSEKIVSELNKCIILCSNCHRALHANELDISIKELQIEANENRKDI